MWGSANWYKACHSIHSKVWPSKREWNNVETLSTFILTSRINWILAFEVDFVESCWESVLSSGPCCFFFFSFARAVIVATATPLSSNTTGRICWECDTTMYNNVWCSSTDVCCHAPPQRGNDWIVFFAFFCLVLLLRFRDNLPLASAKPAVPGARVTLLQLSGSKTTVLPSENHADLVDTSSDQILARIQPLMLESESDSSWPSRI